MRLFDSFRAFWFVNQLPQNYLDYACLIIFVNWIFHALGVVRHDFGRQCHAPFNPNIEPSRYRAQSLKNVNIWITLLPWIESGIVEIIRTPADFDHVLNWESMKRQKQKFEDNPELRDAADVSVGEFEKRHKENWAFRQILLNTPDESLESMIKKLGLDIDESTIPNYMNYIREQRKSDPNFLNVLGPDLESGQMHIISSGTSYDIAQLTASLTKSYLVTDLYVRWREIELDRKSNNIESQVWSPFAKAFHDAPLKFLNNLQLEHALKLRNEGRLESLRGFLHKVWKHARTEEPFEEANAILLAEELKDEISSAEEEWKILYQDLIKIIGREVAAGFLAAGPLIANGHGMFFAAAAAATGTATLARSVSQRKRFPDRFPAAFFMNIDT